MKAFVIDAIYITLACIAYAALWAACIGTVGAAAMCVLYLSY